MALDEFIVAGLAKGRENARRFKEIAVGPVYNRKGKVVKWKPVSEGEIKEYGIEKRRIDNRRKNKIARASRRKNRK